ncbi:MAG: PDZ domain-containing protein [Myxococcota bacterium]|nr:PDZ domain-containing protein [Myxococcota bacterium]
MRTKVSFKAHLSGIYALVLMSGANCAAFGQAPAPPPPKAPPTVKPVDAATYNKSDTPFLTAQAITLKRGYLGVHLTELTPELRAHFGAPKKAGVMVSKVVPKSPAAKAGLAIADIIVAADGAEIHHVRNLQNIVAEKEDKEIVTLKILRNKSTKTIKAKIQQRERRHADLGHYFCDDFPGCEEDCDYDADIDINLHSLGKSLEGLEAHVEKALSAPNVQKHLKKLEKFREKEKVLEKRIRELETRIKDLEKKLQSSNQKKSQQQRLSKTSA